MRNIKRILKENDLGDMGIGAMIVFIAMVLVAGIAASVLIQTANKLEIQAMRTGAETTQEVSTGVSVEGITGQKGSLNLTLTASVPPHAQSWATNNSILNITIGVSPRSGSNGIDLSTTIIEISNSYGKFLLTYNQSYWFLNPDSDGVFSTAAFGAKPFHNMTAKEFGVIVLEDADGSCKQAYPVINKGDYVLLTLSAAENFGGLTERKDIWGSVIPESGAPGIFAFRTPSSYSAELVFDLY
jgi:flagellin FlaB